MFIYCVRNKINNKRYFGKTLTEVRIRRNNHICDAFTKNSQNYFHRVLRKYGLDNFEFEFINDYTGMITENELIEIEKEFILMYKTCSKLKNSQGYNMTIGGEGRETKSVFNIIKKL